MSVKDVEDALALAQSVSIEAPQPLRKGYSKPAEFPINYLSPNLAEVISDIQKKSQAPISIAAQSILATINLVVQGHANILTPWDDIKPISCYFMTIAASGQRKTTCDNKALKQIREHEKALNDNYAKELESWKKSHAIWKTRYDDIIRNKKLDIDSKNKNLCMIGEEPQKPLLPYLTCTDPTFEGLYKLLINGQHSLGMFSSEGGIFFGGYSMNKENKLRTIAAFSSIWDGGRIDRVRGGDEVTCVYNKRLCMHLMIQPCIASKFMEDGMLKNQGLLSRLLICNPTQLEAMNFFEVLDSNSVSLGNFYNYIKELLNIPLPNVNGELRPRTITIPDELKKYCLSYASNIQSKIAIGELDTISDFANKSLEHVLRIATTLMLFDNINAQELSYEYIKSGMGIVDYYMEEMKSLCSSSKVKVDILSAEKLLSWIQKNFKEDYISVRDICQRCHAINTRDEALKAIQVLESHGWLHRVTNVTVHDVIKKEAWRVVRE